MDSDTVETETDGGSNKNDSVKMMEDKRLDDDHIQSTLSKPFSKPASNNLPKLSRCEVMIKV